MIDIVNKISRKRFIKNISLSIIGAFSFLNYVLADKLISSRKRLTKTKEKLNMIKISKLPEEGPWPTKDPFLFCVHHKDNYPNANNKMGPNASLDNRNIGNDFSNYNGWSMYHGSLIPGFPRHPHRGFETVTIVEKGIIDHSDSLGFSARYGDGDVQWLTAGDGIQHSEMFPLFNKGDNNPIDFFQIWINLEAKKKRVKPNFSMFWKDEIPKIITIDKNNIETEILLIAGEYSSKQAPKSPPDSWASNIENNVNIWKIKMNGKAQWELPKVEKQIIRTLYIYHGSGVIINGQTIESGNMIDINTSENILISELNSGTELLLLQAKPIQEPIVKYGPFVMNTKAEIQEAFDDYQATGFGHWTWTDDDPIHGTEYKKFAIGDN